jgi:uncharacterized membrane protein YphA (DoxX/SURF4 family)
MQYLDIVVRCLIGTTFLVSGLSKLTGPDAFGAFVASVGELGPPVRFARPTALIVVAAELVVCVLLAVPHAAATIAGFALTFGLLITFAVAILRAVRRGVRSPCRCFGRSATPLGYQHVIRNVALAAAAVMGAVAAASAAGPPHLGGVALSVVAGVTAGGVCTALDDIVELFRPVRHPHELSSGGNRPTH